MSIPVNKDALMEPGDTPRYGVRANIENHPQVTDFVPRRYRVIAAVLAGCVLLAVGAEAVVQESAAVSGWVGNPGLVQTVTDSALGFSDWISAVVLLTASIAATLVYSLRRYRVDDFRGRYRMWRFAALLGVAASAGIVSGFHRVVTEAGAGLAGTTYLPNGAGWWLLPMVLLGSWLFFRLIRDTAECLPASLALVLAGAFLLLAAATTSEMLPEMLPRFPGAVPRLSTQVGLVLAMTGCLSYARYVVLDVQGLISHPVVGAVDTKEPPATTHTEATGRGKAADHKPKQEVSDAGSEWIDGSEPEADFGASSSRRLSKAEKRRLRKRQAKNRAA